MFFIQRGENRTLIPDIKNVYNEFFNCIYPISICDNKIYEIENRLRFIEDKIVTNNVTVNMFDYFKYKVLSKICIGKTRKKYKNKYKNLKKMLKR